VEAMMEWSFEMELPSTGDEVLVEYEYLSLIHI
jgi:hypothetical protein